MTYLQSCVVLALIAIICGFVIDQRLFAGSILLLSGLWYYLAIRWVDRNANW